MSLFPWIVLTTVALAQTPLPDPIQKLIKIAEKAKAPCSSNLQEHYKFLATQLKFEVAFGTHDLIDGRCHFEFYNLGEKTFVSTPPEMLDAALKNTASLRYEKIHSHPLYNVSFFIEGETYNSEIMFVNDGQVATRKLSRGEFSRLAEDIDRGLIPGFNLSAPSLPDLAGIRGFVLNDGKGPKTIVSKVITSGGIWTYSIANAELSQKVGKSIDNLVAYANMFEMANSPRFPDHRREAYRNMFELVLADEEWGPIVKEWAETGFELRAPYSKEATQQYLNQKDSGLISIEYTKKIEQAQRLCTLLRTLGVEASFTPTWDEQHVRR